MIKLVTFDLDNTLWEIDPVIARANQAIRDWMARQHPRALIHLDAQPFKSLRQQVVDAHPDIAHKPTFLRKQMLYQVFRASALDHAAALHAAGQAFDVFFQHRNEVILLQDAEALLQQLSRRHVLVALSNGNADLQRIGISQYFQAHFNADQMARPKPFPDMFEAALAQAGVQPHEAVHVGDHPDEDVAAAEALGFHTIWFNPPWHPERPDFHPRWHTRHLHEIPALLEQIGQRA